MIQTTRPDLAGPGRELSKRIEATMSILSQEETTEPRQFLRRRFLGEILTNRIYIAERFGDHRKVDRLLRQKAAWIRRGRP